jgi:hypothetical protein
MLLSSINEVASWRCNDSDGSCSRRSQLTTQARDLYLMLQEPSYDIVGLNDKELLYVLLHSDILGKINETKILSLAFAETQLGGSLFWAFRLTTSTFRSSKDIKGPILMMAMCAIKQGLSIRQDSNQLIKRFWDDMTYRDKKNEPLWSQEDQIGRQLKELYAAVSLLVIIFNAFPSIEEKDLMLYLSTLKCGPAHSVSNPDNLELIKLIGWLLCSMRDNAHRNSSSIVDGACSGYLLQHENPKSPFAKTFTQFLEIKKKDNFEVIDHFLDQMEGDTPLTGTMLALYTFTNQKQVEFMANSVVHEKHGVTAEVVHGLLEGYSDCGGNITADELQRDNALKHILILNSILQTGIHAAQKDKMVYPLHAFKFPTL